MVDIQEKVSLDDMWVAYQDYRRHKKNKKGAVQFECGALLKLQILCEEIEQQRYQLRPSECFIVRDPTLREVFCANPRDRIVQHFVYNELNPIIEKHLVYDAANCRKGKGTDFAIKRIWCAVKRESKNGTEPADFLKADISGFFMRINRKLLLSQILHLIDTEYKGPYPQTLRYLCTLIILTDVTKNAKRLSPIEWWDKLPQRKTLFGNPNGLPIGNICSQLFANYYLSELDHLMKARHRSYSRFVDDIIIVDSDIEKLKKSWEILERTLSPINMELSANKTYIGNVYYGIPYLGVRIFPHYIGLGKTRINRLWRQLKSGHMMDSPQHVWQSAASRKGMFTRYHGYRVAKRWYDAFPSEIQDVLMFSTKDYIVPRPAAETGNHTKTNSTKIPGSG